jgi:NAD(P) transhydrogenase subunit alpha
VLDLENDILPGCVITHDGAVVNETIKNILEGASLIMEAVFLTFILMLSIFLGFELINKVPATLHTPLMSGANAISGITVVGAIVLAGTARRTSPTGSAPAVALASINVVGGYMVTDRMLAMFKKKGG